MYKSAGSEVSSGIKTKQSRLRERCHQAKQCVFSHQCKPIGNGFAGGLRMIFSLLSSQSLASLLAPFITNRLKQNQFHALSPHNLLWDKTRCYSSSELIATPRGTVSNMKFWDKIPSIHTSRLAHENWSRHGVVTQRKCCVLLFE